MSAIDLDAWKGAIGRTETRRERCEVESLRRYALAIGGDPSVETILPPLPHWAMMLPQTADGEIGVDGHPRRGNFLPPITLPRRMFAASDMVFEAPLAPGIEAEMISTIVSVDRKSGSSGDLVFVDVDRRLKQDGTVRVRERQTYVYRDKGSPVEMPIDRQLPGGPGSEFWNPEAAHLFRFSAATFNSHRIHYDLPYAQREEGYPALVVHGPFTAAKLAGLAERSGKIRRFAFRAQSPLFLGQPIELQADEGSTSATRCDGAIAMTAKVEYQ